MRFVYPFFFDGYQNHLANLFDVVLRIIKTETSVDCIVCEVAAAYHEGLCPGRFGNFKFASFASACPCTPRGTYMTISFPCAPLGYSVNSPRVEKLYAKKYKGE